MGPQIGTDFEPQFSYEFSLSGIEADLTTATRRQSLRRVLLPPLRKEFSRICASAH